MRHFPSAWKRRVPFASVRYRTFRAVAPCPLVALRSVCNPDAPTLREMDDWSAAFGMAPLAFSCMFSDRSIRQMWQLMNIVPQLRAEKRARFNPSALPTSQRSVP